jgi:hypothetical protein
MNTNGAAIYVRLQHKFGMQTTTCKGYSMTHNGGTLASDEDTWTSIGDHELTRDPSGAGKSTIWSYYLVKCLIPSRKAGAVTGVLYSVILNEQ